jgi:DNA-binding CsgD family transcriptional regulator
MKLKERYTIAESEKSIIRKMRENRATYAAIADHLNLSPNTVKSFCQRQRIRPQVKSRECPVPHFCAQCGQPVTQQNKRKQKRFCSDECRSGWWNKHRQELSKKTAVNITCAHCGNRFESYPQEQRKYCCHACYIQARFGGVRHDTKAS